MEFRRIKQRYSARQLSPAHRYLAMLMGRDLERTLKEMSGMQMTDIPFWRSLDRRPRQRTGQKKIERSPNKDNG